VVNRHYQRDSREESFTELYDHTISQVVTSESRVFNNRQDYYYRPVTNWPYARSNPATYTGVFTDIREIFAQTSEARLRGYKSGRFSFNVKGGRCEACAGDGIKKIEMHFLPDVYVPCEECKGRRYNSEALEIRYRGKNIADVLDMTSEEALDFFQAIPSIKTKMQTLFDVGLGYLSWSVSYHTFWWWRNVSNRNRISRRSTGRTLYVLMSQIGLHFDDVRGLLEVLQRLVEGNTVLIIEHNLDVIKCCDHLIDMAQKVATRVAVVAFGTQKRSSRPRNPSRESG
jgi:excinuclease ABC subunit A